ncbi:BLUF domain-containing protein [Bradyrhizobium sp. 6(2017)]|uniref:BLUF domain-containing protein n=1 Tax=Bradyrhizobium sp. 6(2017) TaxID=1197460 RepID=UPI0013E1A739|nr:BLUF domain-containing protein [Bradyrhizobium sp. 6(2017)]QIG92056.1 BLUF domain-containing protein [Bradyrhizobium sp. 6(2017)]
MSQSEHELIYVSRSNSNVRDSSASEIIRSILAQSRSKNARLGVTGALLFSEGYFCQVLEGERAAVEEIFNAIECDVRHRDITLLTFRPSTPRRFPDWSMAYAGFSAGPDWTHKMEGLLANPSAIDGDRFGRELLVLMTDLVRQQEIDGP